ncbi:MAG: thymidine kinase [Bdellovibrionales bacterium]|nr:thymidine kinase [Bdellovibrionales bacterium]
MAKLYFRYGTVGSAKTLNLLAVAHNYKTQNKKTLLIKPELDVRFGKTTIKSRAGLMVDADYLVAPDTQLNLEAFAGINCVLVDECQFLSPAVIEQLRNVATELNIPVICYGLRTDFKQNLFEGSRRLLELSDTIEEVKNTCNFCNRKAIFNLRLLDGNPTLSGEVIELGADDKYVPACAPCYAQKTAEI